MANATLANATQQKNYNTRWLKNALNSIGLVSKNVLQQLAPNASEFTGALIGGVQSTSKLVTTARKDARVLTRMFESNPYLNIAKKGIANAYNQVKTGNLYNDNAGFSFGDEDTAGVGEEERNVSEGDVQITSGINALNESIQKQSVAQIHAAKANMDAMIAVNSANMTLNSQLNSNIVSRLDTINSNIANLINFNNDSMTKFIEASLAYYERTGANINAMASPAVQAEMSGRPITAADIMNGGRGGLKVDAYKKYVNQNLVKMLKDSPLGPMMDENLLNMFADNPVGLLLTLGGQTITQNLFGGTIEAIEKSFSNFVPTALSKLGDWANDRTAQGPMGFLKRTIGTLFGIRREDANLNLNGAKINRGPIPFDGETKHAITEIITKELREQTAYLKVLSEKIVGPGAHGLAQGRQEFWDYNTNSYISRGQIDKEIAQQLSSSIVGAFQSTDFGKGLDKAFNRLEDPEKDSESLRNAITQLTVALTGSGKNVYGKDDLTGILGGLSISDNIKKVLSETIEDMTENQVRSSVIGALTAPRALNNTIEGLLENYSTSNLLNSRFNRQYASQQDLLNDILAYSLQSSSSSLQDARITARPAPANAPTAGPVGTRVQDFLNDLASGKTTIGGSVGDRISGILSPDVADKVGAKVESGVGIASNLAKKAGAMYSTGFGLIANGYFGKEGEKPEETTKRLRKSMEDAIPSIGKGAFAGVLAGLSPAGLITGGPILGAAIGAASGLLSRNEQFMNFLFGEEEDLGDGTKKRVGGLISAKTQDYLKENKGALITGGLLGSTAGMFGMIAGGPVAGALMGTAAAITAKSGMFQRFLYGDEKTGAEGLWSSITNAWHRGGGFKDSDDTSGLASLAFTGATTGALLSKLGILGFSMLPGGPIGGALAGLGVAIASQKDGIKKFLFGGEKRTGKNKNGATYEDVGLFGRLENSLIANVINPLKTTLDYHINNLFISIEQAVLNPIKNIATFAAKNVGRIVTGSFSFLGNLAKNTLGGAIGAADWLLEKFALPTTGQIAAGAANIGGMLLNQAVQMNPLNMMQNLIGLFDRETAEQIGLDRAAAAGRRKKNRERRAENRQQDKIGKEIARITGNQFSEYTTEAREFIKEFYPADYERLFGKEKGRYRGVAARNVEATVAEWQRRGGKLTAEEATAKFSAQELELARKQYEKLSAIEEELGLFKTHIENRDEREENSGLKHEGLIEELRDAKNCFEEDRQKINEEYQAAMARGGFFNKLRAKHARNVGLRKVNRSEKSFYRDFRDRVSENQEGNFTDNLNSFLADYREGGEGGFGIIDPHAEAIMEMMASEKPQGALPVYIQDASAKVIRSLGDSDPAKKSLLAMQKDLALQNSERSEEEREKKKDEEEREFRSTIINMLGDVDPSGNGEGEKKKGILGWLSGLGEGFTNIFGTKGILTAGLIFGFPWILKAGKWVLENLPTIGNAIVEAVPSIIEGVKTIAGWVAGIGEKIGAFVGTGVSDLLSQKTSRENGRNLSQEIDAIADKGVVGNATPWTDTGDITHSSEAKANVAMHLGAAALNPKGYGAGIKAVTKLTSHVPGLKTASALARGTTGTFEKIANLKNASEAVVEGAETAEKSPIFKRVVETLKDFFKNISEKIGAKEGFLAGSLLGRCVEALKSGWNWAVTQIKGGLEVFGIKASTDIISFGLSEAIFISLGAINGVSGTAKLFHVDPSDVDGTMMFVSGAIGGFAGSTVGAFVDLILQVISTLMGKDLIRSIAETCYGFLKGKDKEEALKKLNAAQEAFRAQYEADVDEKVRDQYIAQLDLGIVPQGTTYEEFLAGVQQGIYSVSYESEADYNARKNASFGGKALQLLGKGVNFGKELIFGKERLQDSQGNTYTKNENGTYTVTASNGATLGTVDKKTVQSSTDAKQTGAGRAALGGAAAGAAIGAFAGPLGMLAGAGIGAGVGLLYNTFATNGQKTDAVIAQKQTNTAQSVQSSSVSSTMQSGITTTDTMGGKRIYRPIDAIYSYFKKNNRGTYDLYDQYGNITQQNYCTQQDVEYMLSQGYLLSDTTDNIGNKANVDNLLKNATKTHDAAVANSITASTTNVATTSSRSTGGRALPLGVTGTGGYGPFAQSMEMESSDGGGFGRMDRLNGHTYFSQKDHRWSGRKYGNDATMNDAGCGPSAVAMALSDATGMKISPVSMANLAQATGDRDRTGTNWNFIGKAASTAGVGTLQTLDPSARELSKQLDMGVPIILSGKRGGYGGFGTKTGSAYTGAGHYVVAVGKDANGNVIINDPRGEQYSGVYDINQLARETGSAWLLSGGMRRRRGGGFGPYTSIGDLKRADYADAEQYKKNTQLNSIIASHDVNNIKVLSSKSPSEMEVTNASNAGMWWMPIEDENGNRYYRRLSEEVVKDYWNQTHDASDAVFNYTSLKLKDRPWRNQKYFTTSDDTALMLLQKLYERDGGLTGNIADDSSYNRQVTQIRKTGKIDRSLVPKANYVSTSSGTSASRDAYLPQDSLGNPMVDSNQTGTQDQPQEKQEMGFFDKLARLGSGILGFLGDFVNDIFKGNLDATYNFDKYFRDDYEENAASNMVGTTDDGTPIYAATTNEDTQKLESWLSVCADIKSITADLVKNYPSNGKKDDGVSAYSQNGYLDFVYDENKYHMRRDCSGYVSTCLAAYDAIPKTSANTASGNMGPNSALASTLKANGWEYMPFTSLDNCVPGDIMLTPGKHVQVFYKSKSGNVYLTFNNGSDSSAKSAGPTESKFVPKFIIRPPASANATIDGRASENTDYSGVGSSVQLTGNTDIEKYYNFLRKQGLTPQAAAGVLGNFSAESGINPKRVEGDYKNKPFPYEKFSSSQEFRNEWAENLKNNIYKNKKGINYNAYLADGEYYPGMGLAQWTGPRGKALLEYAKARNADPFDIGTQLDFLVNGPSEMSSRKTLTQALGSAETVDDATRYFYNGFEMGNNPYGTRDDGSLGKRIAHAQSIYDQMGGAGSYTYPHGDADPTDALLNRTRYSNRGGFGMNPVLDTLDQFKENIATTLVRNQYGNYKPLDSGLYGTSVVSAIDSETKQQFILMVQYLSEIARSTASSDEKMNKLGEIGNRIIVNNNGGDSKTPSTMASNNPINTRNSRTREQSIKIARGGTS